MESHPVYCICNKCYWNRRRAKHNCNPIESTQNVTLMEFNDLVNYSKNDINISKFFDFDNEDTLLKTVIDEEDDDTLLKTVIDEEDDDVLLKTVIDEEDDDILLKTVIDEIDEDTLMEMDIDEDTFMEINIDEDTFMKMDIDDKEQTLNIQDREDVFVKNKLKRNSKSQRNLQDYINKQLKPSKLELKLECKRVKIPMVKMRSPLLRPGVNPKSWKKKRILLQE
jgi:hypothetical protein